MRSRANKRNAALRVQRRIDAIEYLRRRDAAVSSSDMSMALKWGGTKTVEVLKLLREEGLVRAIGLGPATRWEMVK